MVKYSWMVCSILHKLKTQKAHPRRNEVWSSPFIFLSLSSVTKLWENKYYLSYSVHHLHIYFSKQRKWKKQRGKQWRVSISRNGAKVGCNRHLLTAASIFTYITTFLSFQSPFFLGRHKINHINIYYLLCQINSYGLRVL